ncbi:hypothetical protein QIS74_13554 [Colletotrichum tabaci]|uniref:Secreted protein n=1 Tax=Colletotrichum tabaci TaxID=1209068 RepID=A0AAV9SSA1_9PEZI
MARGHLPSVLGTAQTLLHVLLAIHISPDVASSEFGHFFIAFKEKRCNRTVLCPSQVVFSAATEAFSGLFRVVGEPFNGVTSRNSGGGAVSLGTAMCIIIDAFASSASASYCSSLARPS